MTQTTIQITNPLLFRAAQTCIAATNEVRYFLRGVYISPEGDVVGTNGHRLFLAPGLGQIETPDTFPQAGIICCLPQLVPAPAKAPATPGRLELSLDTLSGTYTAGNGKKFLAEIIDGRFPDYKRILPPPVSKTPKSHNLSAIGVNPAYLADVAKALKAESTALFPSAMGKDYTPDGALNVTFHPNPAPEIAWRYIVMPVRL